MKKKRKDIKYPLHKMGKYCGYEEYEDGSIEIAPQYSHQMESVLLKQAALNTLLQSVTDQCHKLLIPITEERNIFWDNIKDDYGLDFDKYLYTYKDGMVIRKLIEKNTEEST